MNSGRAKKIRQAIGYDVAADDIMGRQYDWNTGKRTMKKRVVNGITMEGNIVTARTNIKCVGIRASYRAIKKRINRGEGGIK